MTTVFPAARQAAIFQESIIRGYFQGVISPHTPRGIRRVMVKFLLGLALLIGIVLPSILSHQPAKYLQVAILIPTWVLRARVYTAPESMLSRVASSSWCSSIRSASLAIIAPLSRAFILPHSPSVKAL